HNLLNFCGYFAKSQTRSKVATSAISNYFKTLCRLLVFAMPSALAEAIQQKNRAGCLATSMTAT
ncbi:MAG: hypothetical protein LHW57_04725, partial [Candidatus Cloacimonetes bacterium]|nr:hypothetical protein [Candidatus Cloacimonadota bacterium]